MIGVYPGSFDPLTVAHLAVADATVEALGLDRLDLAISRVALAKEEARQASVDDRRRAIERVAAAGRPWLAASGVDAQLIADIAAGYDVCVMGADKWHQINEISFYEDERARDDALDRLPLVAIVPRPGHPTPRREGLVVIEIGIEHAHVSSTAVRSGRDEWRAR